MGLCVERVYAGYLSAVGGIFSLCCSCISLFVTVAQLPSSGFLLSLNVHDDVWVFLVGRLLWFFFAGITELQPVPIPSILLPSAILYCLSCMGLLSRLSVSKLGLGSLTAQHQGGGNGSFKI